MENTKGITYFTTKSLHNLHKLLKKKKKTYIKKIKVRAFHEFAHPLQ